MTVSGCFSSSEATEKHNSRRSKLCCQVWVQHSGFRRTKVNFFIISKTSKKHKMSIGKTLHNPKAMIKKLSTLSCRNYNKVNGSWIIADSEILSAQSRSQMCSVTTDCNWSLNITNIKAEHPFQVLSKILYKYRFHNPFYNDGQLHEVKTCREPWNTFLCFKIELLR